MKTETGNVSVSTENIFPIIRKWLYSDRDIFLRELVSNAADANAKLKRMSELGEYDRPAGDTPWIRVTFDKAAGTLSIEDNGIGMTPDEIKQYINQIAYSGVMDFVEKYKEKGGESADIIGHFGLGFYSAFMVADKVRIDTLSYQDGAEAASWESEDGMAYTMGPSDKDTRGTLITITLSDEGKGFLTGAKLREILDKYCGYMAFPIYFTDVEAEKAAEKEAEKQQDEEKSDEADEPSEGTEKIEAKPINDTQPLWLKKPSDCTDEEYKDFYRKTFHDFKEPLFWIHLNMDYPFNLKGILYFPKTDNVYENLEGRIKIFYNQVFVADNVKEIIPEFLFLLKGAIDCPDLPLNVSRSFLQNDEYVGKLSGHIIRKVADKLTKLFKDDREAYNRYWQDIGVFVKYGMLREEKFYDKVKDIALFKTVSGEYKVLSELDETMLYTTDSKQQVAYVNIAKAKGQIVLEMNHELDNHFMSFMEFKNQGRKFKRVDAELGDGESDEERAEAIGKLFKDALGMDKLEVKVQSLGESALPAMIQESEESRRMQEMRKQFEQMQGGAEGLDIESMFELQQTLVVNQDQALAQRLQALSEIPGRADEVNKLALQIFDLARLSHGSLSADDMAAFLKRSADLLTELAENID